MKNIIKKFVEENKDCRITFYFNEDEENCSMLEYRSPAPIFFDGSDNVIYYSNSKFEITIVNLDKVCYVDCFSFSQIQ